MATTKTLNVVVLLKPLQHQDHKGPHVYGLSAIQFCYWNLLFLACQINNTRPIASAANSSVLIRKPREKRRNQGFYGRGDASALCEDQRSVGVFEGNRLINVYIKRGNLEYARQTFDKMSKRDISSWNTIIGGYVKQGGIDDARQLFDKMPERDLVSWNGVIAGYGRQGNGEEALKLFLQMQRAGMKPDQFTFGSVLCACAGLPVLEKGKQVHTLAIKTEFKSNVFVGSALVDMYVKCGSICDAHQVFEEMPERNLVSWNAMVAGYARHSRGEDALDLFCRMQWAGMELDEFSFASVLNACASLPALEQGKHVHAYIIKTGFESNTFVGSALVDMYAKCGSIEDARLVFDKIPQRDLVSWTTMITGYAQNGHGKDVLHFFEEMLRIGMKPDSVTFIGVLSACSHAGLVDEGRRCFDSMIQDHCITPIPDHYACMIDLLGRAGRLDEAEVLIANMPFEPNAIVWGALLSACRIHGNMELGERAAERLSKLEPQKAAPYVLLSNIYSASGRWDDAAKMLKMMQSRGVKRTPGCSWIEVKNKMYTFFVADKSHPESEAIYATLKKLDLQMKEVGYVPDTNFLLHDVEDENKEHVLFYHSEKLAIAFGLMSMPRGAPIRIVKNLRVCVDCHTATKLISKIVGRNIVVRDANRFHHFEDGLCSCGDYW